MRGALLLLAFLLAASLPAHAQDEAAEADLVIRDYRFEPARLVAQAGQTITILNLDAEPHNLVAQDGSFRVTTIGAGEALRWTVPEAPGEHFYFCSLHQSSGAKPGEIMTGYLTIEPGAAHEPALRMVDNAFAPQRIEVDAGETVVVANEGETNHNVRTADDAFRTATLAPGDVGNFTAPDAAGEYGFFCSFHPEMTGVLVVRAAASPPTADATGPTAEPSRPTGTGASENEEGAQATPAGGFGLLAAAGLLAAVLRARAR